MSSGLTGLNSPLSYLGVQPTNPPQVFVVARIPTTNDRLNYSIGDLWIVKNANQIYMLVSLAFAKAIWVNLFPGGGGALVFNANVGQAVPSAGSLNLFGDPNISTSGSGDTVTFTLSNGTNGQVLIGGGSSPLWNDLTSTGGTIGFMTDPNYLEVTANGFDGFVTSFITDDSNTVVPNSLNQVFVFGGTNINTAGSGSTVTINLNDDIIVPGDITIDSLGAGVVQSSSTGLLSSNYGTDGQLLISSSTGAPEWNNITSTGGTVTITNAANHINLDVTSPGTGTGNYQFMANQTTNLDNVIGNISNFYALGSSAALTVIFDVGGNVYPGNGSGSPATFTAPVTGLYYLAMCVNVFLGGNDFRGNFLIVTNQRTYNMNFKPITYFSTNNNQGVLSHHVIANMNSGDTAQFQINVGGSIPSANLSGIYNNLTYISGFYLGA